MRTVLESATRTVVIGDGAPFCVIGERINPTGRKAFQAQLQANDLSQIEIDVAQQVAGGAWGVQGVDPFLLIYLNEGPDVHQPVLRTGMMMLDFPGGGLINKIISVNR